MKAVMLFITSLIAVTLPCPAQESHPVAKPADQAALESAPPTQPSPASSPSPAQTPGEDASDTYVIGASDLLTVSVWKEATLSGSMLVRPDGMISMPLLGDVQASGMTPQQLSNQIATRLKKFIQDPNVSVLIGQIHSKVVYTLGEVGKKGPIEMTPGMTLLQAISSAGGLTDYANKGKIYILRTEAGKQLKIPVRYKEALKGDSNFNLVLKPGDTIVVP